MTRPRNPSCTPSKCLQQVTDVSCASLFRWRRGSLARRASLTPSCPRWSSTSSGPGPCPPPPALTRFVVVAGVVAMLLGCAYGIAIVSGLLELQRMAEPDELAGISGVYYS